MAKRKPGRPPKLTDAQWEELLKRHLIDGTSMRKLAKEFNVDESTISERIGQRVKAQRAVARQVADAEIVMDNLPVKDQLVVRTLADHLKAVSGNLLNAARFGAETAARLAQVAHTQSSKINPDAGLEDEVERDSKTGSVVITKEGNGRTLQSVLAMTQGANEAAKTGLNLLAANGREPLPDPEAGNVYDITPKLIPDDPIEASRAYARLIGGVKK